MAKYFINGQSLKDYCEEHNLDYNYKRTQIYKLQKERPYLSTDEVIKMVIFGYPKERKEKRKASSYTKHYIDMMPLKEYCEQNNLSYGTIRTNLSKARNNPLYDGYSEAMLLEMVLAKYRHNAIYYYQGETLKDYCLKNGYAYKSVLNYLHKLKVENPTLSVEEGIKQALNEIKKNNIKYYYADMPLHEYCGQNGLNVKRVREKVKNLMDQGVEEEKAIKEALTYYTTKKNLKDYAKIDAYLKEKKVIEEDILDEIVSYLNIDRKNFLFLSQIFSPAQALNLIWYLHDNKEDKLSISKKRLEDILNIVKLLNKGEIWENNFNILLLIGLYKANLYDTRAIIINNFQKYISKEITSINSQYNLNIDKYLWEEIVDVTNLFILELILRNNCNDEKAIISYMTKSIKYFIFNYFKNLKEEAMLLISENFGGR